MTNNQTDVIIIGAGISGICAAYHLQEKCTNTNFRILEGRENIGGTWDLFKYPGIRSDSDMPTFGYKFKPWMSSQQLADADSILNYLRETVEENNFEKKITFNTKVEKIEWSSVKKHWKVIATNSKTGNKEEYYCNFLITCCGYYNYDKGYTPDFKDLDKYEGKFIHPQHWPENFDVKGKKFTVIGSGATAATLVPSLVKEGAKHVSMLQRSPSYYIVKPREDNTFNYLSKIMSEQKAHEAVRWKSIMLTKGIFALFEKYPKIAKSILMNQLKLYLPKGYPIDEHFNPNYNPGKQRICLIPDGDFFKAISDGNCTMVTDHIERFTKTGILLKSGKEIQSDVIVSATGLQLVLMGGIDIYIDGKKITPNKHYSYKSGSMMSEIPNISAIVGSTTYSWTLKADLIAEYICRLINFMKSNNYTAAYPAYTDKESFTPFIENLTSGYIKRAIDNFPSQGYRNPWRIIQDHPEDEEFLMNGKIDDGYLKFFKQGDDMKINLKYKNETILKTTD